MGSRPVALVGGLPTNSNYQNLRPIQIACQEGTETAKEALHQPPVEAATMARSATAPVGELLTDKNYEYWSACMENYLVGEDLWDVIIGSADKDEIADWNRKNAKALHAIQISCNKDKLSLIIKLKSAKEAWDKLANEAPDSATMARSPIAPVGELLTDKNYKNWSACMKNYLVGEDLWDVIVGSADKDEIDGWNRRNAKALHAIQISCKEDKLSIITCMESAKEAWDKLAEKANELPAPEPATMARSPIAPVAELLTDKNYKNWSACMKSYLVGEDLWDVIVGSADKDEIEGWNRKNAKALHAIQISCRPDKLSPIKGMKSAKEAWDKLAKERQAPQTDDYDQYQPLFKAVVKDDKNAVKQFLVSHREALSAHISNDGNTILIDAATEGNVEMVRELVTMMSVKDMEVKDKDGYTGLSAAAQVGIVKLAKLMLEKNPNLISIRNKMNLLPVVVSATNGHEKMTRYLYKFTPFGGADENAVYDVRLLNCCITSRWFDIAIDLLNRRRDLAITLAENGFSGLLVMAGTPSAFPSSKQLVFWKQFIYSRIPVHDHSTGDIESFGNGSEPRNGKLLNALRQLEAHIWSVLKHVVPSVKHLHKEKSIHKKAEELLLIICDEISNLSHSKYKDLGVHKALFRATKNGLEEVVKEILHCHPYVLWNQDDQGRNVFSYSVAKREEGIFNNLNNLGPRKHVLALNVDKENNNMLHVAAKLPPIRRLEQVSGAALQMQRELQWFEVVKNTIQPNLIRIPNNDGKTPEVLFTEEHRNLVEQGEAWVKNIATSSTVVAALIATIMFAAAFTVPGGYNDNGIPTYLHRKSFSIFVISDALSLFLSSSSIFVFLGILTSRYEEEDFLKSVPTKLIIGLATLFFSIAAMMVNFGSTLVIMLNRRWEWIPIPIMLLSSVPVTLFALLQFPLLVEVLISTYGRGIFNKSSNTDD